MKGDGEGKGEEDEEAEIQGVQMWSLIIDCDDFRELGVSTFRMG